MIVHRPAVTPDSHRSQRPGLVWEETACTLCGRDAATPRTGAAAPIPAEGPGLRLPVVRCRHCGLAYTNPRPTADTIARFYPPDYGPHRTPPPGQRAGPPPQFWTRLFGRPCPERRGLLPGAAPGRLLDFGCGGGGYLRRMADRGWRVTGLDVAPRVVRAIREELDCEAFVGTLPHPELAAGSFDVVTMWQSLEHVHQPLAILREALRVLVPGGTAIVAVPNFDSLSAGWFGPHWLGLDLPRHL